MMTGLNIIFHMEDLGFYMKKKWKYNDNSMYNWFRFLVKFCYLSNIRTIIYFYTENMIFSQLHWSNVEEEGCNSRPHLADVSLVVPLVGSIGSQFS